MRTRIPIVLGLLALSAGCSSGGPAAHGTASRSSDTVTQKDAYAVGCPLVDTALGAGTVAKKLASAALGKLTDSGGLSTDQKQWVSDAKELVSASKPQDVPGSVRDRVQKSCTDHGQKLSNL